MLSTEKSPPVLVHPPPHVTVPAQRSTSLHTLPEGQVSVHSFGSQYSPPWQPSGLEPSGQLGGSDTASARAVRLAAGASRNNRAADQRAAEAVKERDKIIARSYTRRGGLGNWRGRGRAPRTGSCRQRASAPI
ncbi:hypothetical protein [Nannocystis pusilla]|uniref:hypothetical protein n=1 Tax=Nannocystis pusilla TaxID=889268 RepID=UPI003DA2EF45